jgi:hypothetical protein
LNVNREDKKLILKLIAKYPREDEELAPEILRLRDRLLNSLRLGKNQVGKTTKRDKNFEKAKAYIKKAHKAMFLYHINELSMARIARNMGHSPQMIEKMITRSYPRYVKTYLNLEGLVEWDEEQREEILKQAHHNRLGIERILQKHSG